MYCKDGSLIHGYTERWGHIDVGVSLGSRLAATLELYRSWPKKEQNTRA